MKRMLIIAAMLAISPPVISAQEAAHQTCESLDVEVRIGGMGMVDEETLMEHMEETRERLDAVRRSQPRSSLHRRLMREHLAEMRDAWQEMHNVMLRQGCYKAAHGASLEVRMEVVERHVQSMQQMIDQILAHFSELERE